MTRVDFYILPESGGQSRDQFACALTAKVWKAGHRVCLLTDDRESAGAFDNLLWTYQDISFVPHALADSGNLDETPILIGWGDPAILQNDKIGADVLINVADSLSNIDQYAHGFARITEIVGGDAQQRQSARARYREYRDQGHELHDHRIDPGSRMRKQRRSAAATENP